jgi:hypothetical protein
MRPTEILKMQKTDGLKKPSPLARITTLLGSPKYNIKAETIQRITEQQNQMELSSISEGLHAIDQLLTTPLTSEEIKNRFIGTEEGVTICRILVLLERAHLLTENSIMTVLGWTGKDRYSTLENLSADMAGRYYRLFKALEHIANQQLNPERWNILMHDGNLTLSIICLLIREDSSPYFSSDAKTPTNVHSERINAIFSATSEKRSAILELLNPVLEGANPDTFLTPAQFDLVLSGDATTLRMFTEGIQIVSHDIDTPALSQDDADRMVQLILQKYMKQTIEDKQTIGRLENTIRKQSKLVGELQAKAIAGLREQQPKNAMGNATAMQRNIKVPSVNQTIFTSPVSAGQTASSSAPKDPETSTPETSTPQTKRRKYTQP